MGKPIVFGEAIESLDRASKNRVFIAAKTLGFDRVNRWLHHDKVEFERKEQRLLRDIVAAIEMYRRMQARSGVMGFARYMFKDFDENWHHEVIANALDKAFARKIKRLIITAPPRHSKSEFVSKLFPPYVFGKDPAHNVMTASYGDKLAKKNNQAVQRYMGSRKYASLFPGTKLPSGKKDESGVVAIKTQNAFEIEGHPGIYLSSGVSGAQTGMGFHYGIIDDPVKDRAEAESPVIRDSIWDWYVSTFYTRQIGSNAVIIIIVTRWHEDDLVGRLLDLQKTTPEADQWTLVNLPAIMEAIDIQSRTPGDNRGEGEALWEGWYNLDYLRRAKATMGEYDWLALYQQRPTPSGGARIQEQWLSKVVDWAPEGLNWVRSYDLAVSKKETADETATFMTAMDWEGNFYIAKGDKWQEEWPTTRKKLVAKSQDEHIPIVFEVAGQQKGFYDDLQTIEELNGVPIIESNPVVDKLTRALPWIAKAEAGKLIFVRGDDPSWIAPCKAELTKFTGINDKRDNQVDAISIGYWALNSKLAPDVLQALSQLHKNSLKPQEIKVDYGGALEIYKRPQNGKNYYLIASMVERQCTAMIFDYTGENDGHDQCAEFYALDFSRVNFIEAINRLSAFFTSDGNSSVSVLVLQEGFGENVTHMLKETPLEERVSLFPSYEIPGMFKREDIGSGWKQSNTQKDNCLNYLKAGVVRQLFRPHGKQTFQSMSQFFRDDGKQSYAQMLTVFGTFAYLRMQSIDPIRRQDETVEAII